MTDHAIKGWLAQLAPRTPGKDVADDHLDWAKLTAIVLMAASHTMLAFDAPVSHWGHWIGRPCVPVFAYLIVARLSVRPPERGVAMIGRLVVWGLIAQPIYTILRGDPVIFLNVMFTLATGVALMVTAARQWTLATILILAAALVFTDRLDGGGLAALAMLAGWTLYRRSPQGALAAVVALTALHNALLDWTDWVAVLSDLVAAPIVLASRALPAPPFRVPGLLFYAFYAVHLGVIWLIFGTYDWN
jgi:hypothetical protein